MKAEETAGGFGCSPDDSRPDDQMAHDSYAADCPKRFLDDHSPLFTGKLPIGIL